MIEDQWMVEACDTEAPRGSIPVRDDPEDPSRVAIERDTRRAEHPDDETRRRDGRGGLHRCSGQPNLMDVIVCHCNAVSDRALRKAVARGASTVADLMVACDAGTCCGACHPELEALLALGRKAVTSDASAPRPLAGARRPSRS